MKKILLKITMLLISASSYQMNAMSYRDEEDIVNSNRNANDGETVFHKAVINYDIEGLKKLLKDAQKNPLNSVYNQENLKIVAPWDMQDANNQTPLGLAIMRMPKTFELTLKNTMIIKTLQEANAQPNSKNISEIKMLRSWEAFLQAMEHINLSEGFHSLTSDQKYESLDAYGKLIATWGKRLLHGQINPWESNSVTNPNQISNEAPKPTSIQTSQPANLKKYRSYINEMKDKYSDNLIANLNEDKPANIPNFDKNAQIDITVTVEISTSTAHNLESGDQKFNYDALNNILYFDNTIIDNSFNYSSMNGAPYKGIIKIHVVDNKNNSKK